MLIININSVLTFCFVYGFKCFKKLFHEKLLLLKINKWGFQKYLHNVSDVLNHQTPATGVNVCLIRSMAYN
jgi:hypothetical protein